jgi:hypothetical protein
MRSFFVVALLFTTVAACGGHLDTDPHPDGGPTCPNNAMGACSDNGATCSLEMNMCGHPGTEQCTCMNGSWACPIYECPQETCPVDTTQGTACSTNGMSCPSNVFTTCTDVPVTCVCDGNQFECPIPLCPPPQPCPPPDQIVAGQNCFGPTNELCPSNNGDCFCQGTWQCEGIDAGPPDAGDSD